MRRYLSIVMLICLLTACGQPAQSGALVAATPRNPTAAPAQSAAPPTASPAPTLGQITAAPPTASPPPALPSAVVPTATLAAAEPSTAPVANPTAAPSSSPAALPPGMQQVTWNGVRFRYEAKSYSFSETAPHNQRVREDLAAQAMAGLSHTPDGCVGEYIHPACLNEMLSFSIYPSEGLDLATWLERTDPAMFSWHGATPSFSENIGEKPTVGWTTDAGQSLYAIDLGEQILIMHGIQSEWYISSLQFVTPGAALAVGESVMATQPTNLWSAPADGGRVEERPELYAGSLATILDLQGGAAQVLTIDNVVGWVHDTAALTSAISLTGPRTRFIAAPAGQAQVIHSSAIPLRDRPHSTGLELGAPIEPGGRLTVMGVAGDWLQVALLHPDGTAGSGWMRWFYGGTEYIAVVQP